VTVESTTEVVLSATSTITVTTSETNYTLKKRSHVRKDKVQERAAAPVITPRAELPKKMILKARQAASSANTRSLDASSLGAALSSACSCKSLPPLTQILTSTAPAVVSDSHSRGIFNTNESRRGPLEPRTFGLSLSIAPSVVA
jgi:hypothetical protein